MTNLLLRFLSAAIAVAFACCLRPGIAAEMSEPMPAKMDTEPMTETAMQMMPEIGGMAPRFALRDAAGHEVRLESLLARGRVALVFYRSGEWCPFCVAQLKELQAHLAEFQTAGLQVVGISYDRPDVLARVAKTHGLSFPLLSDSDSATIDAFGLRNHEATGRAVGVPHPAVFIVDEQGTIRARLRHESYRTRPTPAEIIAAAAEQDAMMSTMRSGNRAER